MTWRVAFYGENRIAIAALPPLSADLKSIVRELKASGRTKPEVDPHFELYSGLEAGEPKPVPLQVKLSACSGQVRQYLAEEDAAWREMFSPLPNSTVIVGLDMAGFQNLREYFTLRRDTRLDHTLVFQVDEFWQQRRVGGARNQNHYLDEITSGEVPRDEFVDPFLIFLPSRTGKADKPGKAQSRIDSFKPVGYQLYGDSGRSDHRVDRIPFLWDFGFLLCDYDAWNECAEHAVAVRRDVSSKPRTVKEILSGLPLAYGFVGDLRLRRQPGIPRRLAPTMERISWRVCGCCRVPFPRQKRKNDGAGSWQTRS